MDIDERYLSVLEAMHYLGCLGTKVTNKVLRDYYNLRKGSHLPYFYKFSNFSKLPNTAKAYQWTIHRYICSLSKKGFVKIKRKPLGKKPFDYYSLTSKGRKLICQSHLRYRVLSVAPGMFARVQAPMRIDLWTVEK